VRRFTCERCGADVAFESSRCARCGSELGYLPEQLDVRVLRQASSPSELTVDGVDHRLWRCLNAAWGCNWVLAAGGPTVWCRSCRLTRGRPDETNTSGIEAWSSIESAKRRLVHQLDALGLTFDERTQATPEGLAFDLVHLPGRPEVSGYFEGVITFDLTEASDERRDELRRQFAEPLRSVIGHLRHEIGHYYWNRLVGADDVTTTESFRRLFGDERVDYPSAIAAYYNPLRPPWDPALHITPYAAAHPLEDWAETFAHHLHISDALETAEATGLAARDRVGTGGATSSSFADLLDRWAPVAAGVNAVAASLGAPDVYPLTPRGPVVEKLSFVHERVWSASQWRWR
jgi:hypothetical protein